VHSSTRACFDQCAAAASSREQLMATISYNAIPAPQDDDASEEEEEEEEDE